MAIEKEEFKFPDEKEDAQNAQNASEKIGRAHV